MPIEMPNKCQKKCLIKSGTVHQKKCHGGHHSGKVFSFKCAASFSPQGKRLGLTPISSSRMKHIEGVAGSASGSSWQHVSQAQSVNSLADWDKVSQRAIAEVAKSEGHWFGSGFLSYAWECFRCLKLWQKKTQREILLILNHVPQDQLPSFWNQKTFTLTCIDPCNLVQQLKNRQDLEVNITTPCPLDHGITLRNFIICVVLDACSSGMIGPAPEKSQPAHQESCMYRFHSSGPKKICSSYDSFTDFCSSSNILHFLLLISINMFLHRLEFDDYLGGSEWVVIHFFLLPFFELISRSAAKVLFNH